MTEIERLKKRVGELEAEVARLKAEPREVHYHYPPEQFPLYIAPQTPPQIVPWKSPWIVTCQTQARHGD